VFYVPYVVLKKALSENLDKSKFRKAKLKELI